MIFQRQPEVPIKKLLNNEGNDDMSLGEPYESLMSNYQEIRALNDELMKLLELT